MGDGNVTVDSRGVFPYLILLAEVVSIKLTCYGTIDG